MEVAGDPARPNHVVPRAVLDARLVEAATAAGAELRRAVRRLEQHDGLVVVDGELAARVVVGADGANSTVRRLLGAPPNPDRALAIAVRGYAPAPAGRPEQLIAWVAEGWPAYVWSFPTGTGVANVGYGLLRSRFHGDRAELHQRLHDLLPEADPDPASLRAHHLPFSSSRPPPGGAGSCSPATPPRWSTPCRARASTTPWLGPPGRPGRPDRAPGPGRRLPAPAHPGPRPPPAPRLGAGQGDPRPGAGRGRPRRRRRLPRLFDTLVELGLGQARITPRLLAALPAGLLRARAATRGTGSGPAGRTRWPSSPGR